MPLAAWADSNTWVVLRMKGGASQAYLIPGRMIVRTEKDSIRLTSPMMEVAYPKTMVEGYFFQSDDDIPTEIEDVIASSLSVRHLNEDEVIISGIGTNVAVRVYGVNGIEHPATCEYIGEAVVVSLRNLPKGTFLIRIEGKQTIKVVH